MGLLDTIFSTAVARAGVEALTRKVLNFPADFTFEDDPANNRTNLIVALTATALADHAVTNAKLRESAARSIIGRAAGTAGDVADITATIDDRLFARAGGELDFVQLALGMVPDALLTRAKMNADVFLMQYVAVSASRALLATDYYKTLEVDSSGASRTITMPKTATLAVPVGASGLIRRFGASEVSVAAEDGTVTLDSSGDEYKVSRDKGQIYWELRAANRYWIGGEKKV
jgi:hypothetical protein